MWRSGWLILASSTGCAPASGESEALDAQIEACGAERHDFRIGKREGRIVVTPIRPDDAMVREWISGQRCVTDWARKNGFEVTASDWNDAQR